MTMTIHGRFQRPSATISQVQSGATRHLNAKSIQRPTAHVFAEVEMEAYGQEVAPGYLSGYRYFDFSGDEPEEIQVQCPAGSGVKIDSPNDGCQNFPTCKPGFIWDGFSCKFENWGAPCKSGNASGTYDEYGKCITHGCDPGYVMDPQKGCVPEKKPQPTQPAVTCAADEIKDASGKCVKKPKVDEKSTTKTEKKSNTALWVGGAILLAAAGVGAAMYMKKDDSESDEELARGSSTPRQPNPTSHLGYQHNPIGIPTLLLP